MVSASFVVFVFFFAKTLSFHEFIQSGGRNETICGSNVSLWCYRLTFKELLCVKLPKYDVVMPHTRSFYRVTAYLQVIIIPIDRNIQREVVSFHL